MQQTKLLRLRRIRSFDEVFGDAFSFLRIHFRPLGKHLLIIAAPVAVVTGVAHGIATYGYTEASPLATFLSFLFNTLPDILAQTITCAYIVLCNDAQGAVPSDALVRTATYRLFMRIVLCNILYSLATGIGLLVFVIPGVYMSVALVMITMAHVEENRPVLSCFDRSISLVKGHWWQTFGILLIVLVIWTITNVIASLPSILFIATSDTLSADGPLYSVTSMISTFFSAVVGIAMISVLHTVLAMHYYSLVEKKEATGLRERIDELHPDEDVSQNSLASDTGHSGKTIPDIQHS